MGCSKSQDYPTLLSQFEKDALREDDFVQRHVAANGEDLCFKDAFTVDAVKRQIQQYEKKYKSTEKVSGNWKHLNLADLPIPQANFLKKYGDKIGDLSNPDFFDYSSCRDVPCIINTVYEKEGDVAGYVHYLWYLKMGNYLSASNGVFDRPDFSYHGKMYVGVYNGKKLPVSAYLYSPGEIFSFWRLLGMLEAPYTNLVDLKEIHRLPRGHNFESVEKERAALIARGQKPGNSVVCGLAYSEGYIVFQDLCLSIDPVTWDDVSFNSLVMHELTHHLDFQEGRKYGKFYRSHADDYVAVSPFSFTEFTDSNGAINRKWTRNDSAGFVRDYAKTSIVENFADTLATFRASSFLTKERIAAKQYNFISQNYFDKKEFTREAVISSWFDREESELSRSAFKAVADCSTSTATYASRFFKTSDFTTPVSAKMLNCLGSKAGDISLEMRLKLKVSEPEGCRFLQTWNLEKDWDPKMKETLSVLMTKYLNEALKDKEYFEKVQEFVTDISNPALATRSFLKCTAGSSENDCYSKLVLEEALAKLARLNVPSLQAQELAEMYLANHPIEKTTGYISQYYTAFVKSYQDSIDIEAEKLFSECSSQSDDIAPPVGTHFSVGSGYLVSSIYNCINSKFPETAKYVVKGLTVNGKGIQHPKEEVILYQGVMTILRASLEEIYLKKQKAESESISHYLSSKASNLGQTVKSNFSWVRNVLDPKAVQLDCVERALSQIELKLKYHYRSEIFGQLVQRVCQDIDETPEYKNWLDNSKSTFQKQSFEILKTKVLNFGRVQAEKCLQSFPVDTSLNRLKFKEQREACLVDVWGSVEEEAISQMSSDPLTVKFEINVSALKPQLETGRRRLQLTVIKEKF